MAVLDKIKKYYKLLPVQLTVVNRKAAQIASEIYKAAVESNAFGDREDFNPTYGDKLEKYILYYDIGKCELHCSDIKINRITVDNEMIASRKNLEILDEVFNDSKLTAEDLICKEILYYAAEKNEQEELMNHLFLQQLLDSLEERDRQLINLRYFENKTQSQVAQILGISQVQVSRLEKRILRRMKDLA